MKVNFNAVLTLPGILEPNSFYYVQNGSFAEGYLTDAAGTAKAVGNSTMINSLVGQYLIEWEKTSNEMPILATIAERDDYTASLEKNSFILVIDASADPTVGAGSALYAFDFEAQATYKVAEYESMDVVLKWSALEGRPDSTPAQIDSSVSKSHSHTNKAVIDGLSDEDGELKYKGEPISTAWATSDW